MRLFAIRCLFLIAALGASGYKLAALGTKESPVLTAGSGQTILVTDMRGRTVTLPRNPDSIVALGAGSLRLAAYLDAVDLVVAVEDQGHGREKTVHEFFNLATYRLAFPELRALPSIGSAENHEGLIAAAPDLVLSSAVDPGQLDQLQKILGIPVFGIDADVELHDTDRFFLQLKTVGTLLGRDERAAELIAGIRDVIADLETRRGKVTDPVRAYAGGMMFFGPADLLRTSGDYIPFTLTGTINVMPSNPAGQGQPYLTSIEDLIVAAPAAVFVDAANLALARSGFVRQRQLLSEQVPAFRNREVYSVLVYKYYGTNWESQLANAYFVGSVLYPAAFGGVDVAAQAESIWELFFGVRLDYRQVCSAQGSVPDQVGWFD